MISVHLYTCNTISFRCILSHVCFITTVFIKHQLNKEYALYRIISCIWDGHMLQCSELHRDIFPTGYNYISCSMYSEMTNYCQGWPTAILNSDII